MVGLHLSSSILKALITDNVVTLKDAPGLVSRDHHGHSLGDPGPYHVSYSRSPEIMEEFCWDHDYFLFTLLVPDHNRLAFFAFQGFANARLATRAGPCLSEAPDSLPVSMKDPGATKTAIGLKGFLSLSLTLRLR